MSVVSVKNFKSPVKRALKKLIIRTRDRILSLEDEQRNGVAAQHDYGQNDFTWTSLSAVLERLLVEGGNALRPNYAWGVLQGVSLAKVLGIDRVSVIEFGVAGGNGLLSLEKIAERVEAIFGVSVDVYGFDTGSGLPKSTDYRDCPNLWLESAFPMDVESLKQQLRRARLILGLVEDTVPAFLNSNPPPIAFISFDLDYYRSTKQAFRVLEAEQALLLPRIHCYFDDILGFTFSDFTGERLAIDEFNNSHSMRKISNIYGLHYYLPEQYITAVTPEKQYMAHIFDHRLYCQYDRLVRRPFDGFTDLADQHTPQHIVERPAGAFLMKS